MLIRVKVIDSFAERYRVLLEFAGDGVTIRQLDSIIIAADNAMATLLGQRTLPS